MGFSTFGRTGPAGVDAILCALDTGYRHLDTAQSYDTEVECGEALRHSGLPRGDVFVTTKITGVNCRPGALMPSLRRSCRCWAWNRAKLTSCGLAVSVRDINAPIRRLPARSGARAGAPA
jgi:2,5-diketo-D-gluconate reductase B